MLLLSYSGHLVHAQNTNSTTTNNTTAVTNGVERDEKPASQVINAEPPVVREVQYRYLSSPEALLSLLVIGLALITLLLQFRLLKSTSRLTPEDILRVFGGTLIIFGALFFVSAGFDTQQLAGVMGLFGTIAGYLLGRTERTTKTKERKNEPNA